MPALQITVKASELPIEWQRGLGIDQAPETRVEIRVLSAEARGSIALLKCSTA